MTQTQNSPNSPASPEDSLSRLHKMSATAGAGTQEYVALNVTAITAAVFGLASLLAELGDILMVIPVVGVILGIVALRQIGNSNGTQTGRPIAWFGLAISVAVCIFLLGGRGVVALQQASDSRALEDMSKHYGDLIVAGKYSDVYDMFDADFKHRVGADEFITRLNMMQTGRFGPPIDRIASNGMVEFSTNAQGVLCAVSFLKIHYKSTSNEDRESVFFQRSGSGDSWKIDNIPSMFPPKKDEKRVDPASD